MEKVIKKIKELTDFLDTKDIEGHLFLSSMQNQARRMSDDYNGGLWEIKKDEDKYFYFILTGGKEEYNVSSSMNSFQGVMSKKAFILAIFSITLSAMTFHCSEKNNPKGLEFYGELYYLIRDNISKILPEEDLSSYYGLTD